jgi:hypothetical protein
MSYEYVSNRPVCQLFPVSCFRLSHISVRCTTILSCFSHKHNVCSTVLQNDD